jgi:predicted nucleic acid-binding protein
VIVVDTTVLVYAVGDAHALREPAQALLSVVAQGRVRATTTPEVIQEFAHVRARRRDRRDATALAAAYADLFSPLLEVGEADLREGLRLFERRGDLGAFDAVLAATALGVGAAGIVSADLAFASVQGLAHHALDALDVERLSSS